MNNNLKQHIAFGLYTLALLVSNALFHYYAFDSLVVENTGLSGIAGCWLPMVAVSLLFSAFVFLFKRNWWTIVVLFVLNIWFVASTIYFRANNILLTYKAITLAGNLGGLGGSISLYINYKPFVFIGILIVYACLLLWLSPKNTGRNLRAFAVTVILALVLSVLGGWANYNNHQNSTNERKDWTKAEMIAPFYGACNNSYSNPLLYVEDHSITAYLPYAFLNGFVFSGTSEANSVELTENEKQILETIYDSDLRQNEDSQSTIQPTKNLLLICVESLESWTIGMKDLNGNYIAPNLTRLTEGANAIYAPYTKTQVRHGVSSDGHLMMNTGLMPLQDGAAVHLYADNTYPNLAHFYNYPIQVNAPAPEFWNETKAARNYGYAEMVKPVFTEGETEVFTMAMDKSWSDGEMYEHALKEWMKKKSPKCMMTITISSHTPFTLVEENPNIHIAPSAPRGMKRYLSCIHYTDSCLGQFLSELEQNSELDSTCVLITGDHTVFKNMMWHEYRRYLIRNNVIDRNIRNNYVPIIIIDPQVEKRLLTDECQQADIYPTLLHLIGCEKYSWQGFGINLADTTARRQLSEYDAYLLSDKLIRQDYFREKADSVSLP